MSNSPFRFCGADSDFMYWETGSWSRPDSGVVHEQIVDRRDGSISCSCEDSLCRKKGGNVMDDDGNLGCKHVQRLHKLFKAVLKEPA